MPCSCSVPGDVPLKQRANTLSQPQVDTMHSWAHVDTQTSPSQEVSLRAANNPASGTQRHHRRCETPVMQGKHKGSFPNILGIMLPASLPFLCVSALILITESQNF